MYSPLDTFLLGNSIINQLTFTTILILGFFFFINSNKNLLFLFKRFYSFINSLTLNNKNLLLLSTLFIFISLLNLVGLFPYTFALTAQFSITLLLSISIWFNSLFLLIANYGRNFFAHFLPSGIPLGLSLLLIPIEIISYLARALSLGVRLSANIISGHLLTLVLMSFVPKLSMFGVVLLLLIIILTILEIAVCIIQGYVFSTLVAIYLDESHH